MAFKKVTHIIFDMDGLLLDTETIFDNIMIDFAKRYSKSYTLELKVKFRGAPESDTANIAVNEMKLPLTKDEFIAIFKSKIKTESTNAPLMPGAKELIHHFHKHKIPMAVATSSTDDETVDKTQHHRELFNLFDHIVSGSNDIDVKAGKPEPDIFLVCASRFSDKPKPEQCLVFEDSPNGVRGARSAGMQAVMVPDKVIPEELRKPATLVLNSLTEFKPEVFGLPAFD